MPQLSCTDLTLGYDGKPVIAGLSFQINPGDYLCIVGENGSGKSTLIKALLRLNPQMSGEIIAGDDFVSREIGYLPQQTDMQKDFPASVREIVRSGCIGHSGRRPFYSRSEKKLAEEKMEMLGIASIAKSSYRELSGGQQRRALLARALCAARSILLLDEPAAGLDPKASSDMYDIITDLNDGGITIVMVSHDVSASIRYASHILHIGNGCALFFGSKAQYADSDIGKSYASWKGA